MQAAVRALASATSDRPLRVLELGSWAGASAITWASSIKRFCQRGGTIVCVDSWAPFFNPAEMGTVPVYQEMHDASKTGDIFTLFLHNVSASGHDDIILPLRGTTAELLSRFPAESFDIVYVDASHFYDDVRHDLTHSLRLVRLGGYLCGDDLEAQLSSVDRLEARGNGNRDYVPDRRSGVYLHAGVTVAVGEIFGNVAEWEGFWAVQRNLNGWNISPDVPFAGLDIPQHLLPWI
ncbi:MAG: class I SAM-dependent methyltransferase [Phycisphaerae bacterium]|nr:class I SAM-dependent methyltransferase [Phycisphaerae bacterium]